jgi:hypothetical protein
MAKESAAAIAAYTWELQVRLEKADPKGELAASARMLARFADRYASGSSQLKPTRIDVACSTPAWELADELQASGIRENWLIVDLRCFSEALEIAAWLEGQAAQAELVSEVYTKKLKEDARKQYEAARDCLKRRRPLKSGGQHKEERKQVQIGGFPVVHRFAVKNWVRNKRTNEDGQVKGLYEQNGIAMYEVSVPNDPSRTSWELGAERADWADNEVQPSTSETLPA